MNKLITAFMLFFVFNVIFSAIMEGGGGFASTRLTDDITSADTTLNVASTQGFLESSYLLMGDEKVRYVATTDTTITVAANGRGYDNTDATAHYAGAMVYTPEAGVLNAALGFNVTSTGSTVGEISIPTVLTQFFFRTLPKLITWDFAHLRGSEWLEMIRLVFIAISVGFIIYICYQIASALGFIMQRW